jgi:adenosine deaminase
MLMDLNPMSTGEPALRDRLYADALAWDLRVSTRLERSMAQITRSDIEQYVDARANIYCRDLQKPALEINRLRKAVLTEWEDSFGDGPWRSPSLLSRAARRLLQPHGSEMILRVDRVEPGREILRWRYVSLAIPPEILMAAATPNGAPPSEAIRILDPSIAPDHAVAHHHVHHAAMRSFEDLWASLRVRALLRPGELIESLREPRAFCPELHQGVCPGKRPNPAERRVRSKELARPRLVAERARHMAEWGDRIRQAFIAARALERHSRHSAPLDQCTDSICSVFRTTLRAFLTGRAKSLSGTATPYPWPAELVRLAREENTKSGRSELIQRLLVDERRFLVRMFAHLRPDDPGSHDPQCEALFGQYLRVKAAVFRLLVHPPGEPGIQNFLEHFQQIKVYGPDSDVLRPLPPHEAGLDVRATEYRVAPDTWFNILRDGEIEKTTTHGETRGESAWLIHFKRTGPGESVPLFGAAIREMESQADQVAHALARNPAYLRTLRGVDICGVEEMQPLWVSAETLRRVRRVSHHVASGRPRMSLKPLRLTLHAGEEFAWLTSGLRAIAEPFRWELIERGDRIGHGIAITLDPVEWWGGKNGKEIHVKRIDRLLDLAFLADYARRRTSAQDAWLRSEVDRVLKVVSPNWSIDRAGCDSVDFVRKIWLALGSRTTRTLLETPRYGEEGGQLHERWLHAYLWNPSAQKRLHAAIPLRVDNRRWPWLGGSRTECELLVKARARLLEEVVSWQVCIESNPTSNLVVGGLDDMGAAQDAMHRRPTQKVPLKQDTLTWTISTDDPVTFSTNLADEYAYAWAGMVLRKNRAYDPSYARALLDEAAATSMRMRFTGPTLRS